MDPIEELNESIVRAGETAPIVDVVSVLLSHFVGIVVQLARQEGHDMNLPIQIDGGSSRDVTIGPAKH